MVLVKQKCTVGGASFDLWIVQVKLNKFMYGGHAIAQFLGYKQPDKAIRDHVKAQWKLRWDEIEIRIKNNQEDLPIQPGLPNQLLPNKPGLPNQLLPNKPGLSQPGHPIQPGLLNQINTNSVELNKEKNRVIQVPSNWQPNTMFITDAGVYALIMRSKLPFAEQFQEWLFEKVLPELLTKGTYTMNNVQSNADTVAAYDKKLADAQMEALNLKLQLADNTNKLVTMERDYALQIMEIKQNNALQMMEIRQNYINMLSEQKFKMQLEINNLNAMIDKGSFQFAVNALLARDNIEENTQLRQTLKDIDGCVVPKLDNPEKEEYITCYYRVVDGMNRLRTCRTQLHEIEQHDKKVERYHAASKKFGVIKKPQRYTWLYESHKCLQIKCANPVTVWLKIRSKHPHLFYGLRYTNKIKTEIEVLKEEDLRIKYRNSVDMCERNKSVHSKQIAEFKALGLIDENDCVAKCLTPNDEIIQRIKTVIENMMDEFSNIAPSTPQRTHSNAAQFYKPQDFTTIYNNRDNYFVNNFFMPEQQQVAIQDK
ncbi:bro [Spodoptera frugiperda granulovirus]|uniref:Bro n=1 Tax=Spodoptera frugiperda granulovirus TaxID=307454 RepID=A0A0C5AQ85_9BBAC|nr:bro [Spodoptera frugiperda granulovirus]AJK91751.1 bro [Spodoptera frugiperda granulovirus]